MINLGDQLQVLDLKANASVNSSTTSSALDLQALSDEIKVILDVSAPVAGSSPTLACKVTECDTSGGSYTDVASGGFTGVTSAQSSQAISLNKNELKRYIKLDYTIGGTSSPQYYVCAKVVGINKYPA